MYFSQLKNYYLFINFFFSTNQNENYKLFFIYFIYSFNFSIDDSFFSPNKPKYKISDTFFETFPNSQNYYINY